MVMKRGCNALLAHRLKDGERRARKIGEVAEDLQDIFAKGGLTNLVQARARKGRHGAGWSATRLCYPEVAKMHSVSLAVF